MCAQCTAKAKLLAIILPKVGLYRARQDSIHPSELGGWATGKLGIVRMNDPDWILDKDPWPDPHHGMSDDEVDALSESEMELWDKWFEDVLDFEDKILRAEGLNEVSRLVLAAKEAGWNPDEDGRLSGWLFHRIGMLLKDGDPSVKHFIAKKDGEVIYCVETPSLEDIEADMDGGVSFKEAGVTFEEVKEQDCPWCHRSEAKQE